MICDKCNYEYEIGEKGSYNNVYGTRCPKCNHLIKPIQEPKFIRDMKDKKQSLINKILPIMIKKIKEEPEE